MKKKILIIRFSSIGDIVLTTPVIRCLKEQLGAEIHFLTKPAFAPILQSNPHVDQVIALTKKFDETIELLLQHRYDCVIDLHHNLRSMRIKRALKAPSFSFNKLNFQKWLMVNLKINQLPSLHIVDRYLKTVASLGIVPDGKGLDFFIPETEVVNVTDTFGVAPNGYTALVIGAAHNTKCLTETQLIQLCQTLKGDIILLGGRDEADKAEAILQATSLPHVKNGVGILTIMESASVIGQAVHVITHDTGMMHIAAALRKEQTVVWGNTIPAFGMYPYYGNEPVQWHSAEVTGLPCRPCSKIGYDSCPKGHFKCMMEQDLLQIANRIPAEN